MISGVNHITLSVRDIDTSFSFYTELLGFIPVALWSTGAYLKAGETWIALVEQKKQEIKPASGYTHIAFSIEQSEFSDFVKRLEAAAVHSWQLNRSEGDSHYFLDPDGHQLEVHCTDLEARLREAHRNPWDRITFFPESS